MLFLKKHLLSHSLWVHPCTDHCNIILLLHAAPSMSHFLNQTSKVVLDKYQGDLDNLRKEAKHDAAKERELVKEFKVQTDLFSACRLYCCVFCGNETTCVVRTSGSAFLSALHEPACKQEYTLS